MEIILRPRRSGKTTELIKMAAEHGYYIVTTTRSRAEEVRHQADKIGLHILMPLTAREWRSGHYAGAIKELLFDDVEQIIQSLSIAPVRAITLTGFPKLDHMQAALIAIKDKAEKTVDGLADLARRGLEGDSLWGDQG